MIWPSLFYLQTGSLRPRLMERYGHRRRTNRWKLKPSVSTPSLAGLSELVMLSLSTEFYYSFKLINISSFPSLMSLKIETFFFFFYEILKLFPGNAVSL